MSAEDASGSRGSRRDLRRSGRVATILTVCTGNICRSPLGEVLLRASIRGLPVRVHSAGTQALAGHGMTIEARRLAVARGADDADADRHRARLLVGPMLEEADLVLAVAREHRTRAVQLAPSILRRTFTVREFARLGTGMGDADVRAAADRAGDDPGERLRALARAVGDRRGLLATDSTTDEDDDVVDPYLRSPRVYELSAAQLAPAIDVVARLVRAAVG